MISDMMAFFPEIFLCVSAMVLLTIGVFKRPLTENGLDLDSFNLISVLSMLTLLITAILVIVSPQMDIFNGQLTTKAFTAFMQTISILAAAISLFVSRRWLIKNNMLRFEYAILVLFAVLGMMIMVASRHLLMTYLGLELQSLSLYILAASQRNDSKASEAGLKYFILGAISSAILLYGISMVFGATGSLGYEEIAAAIAQNTTHKITLTGMVFILIATAFKVSAAPFHMWTPDVYEGAPTPVTAFFAVAPKIAAFSLLISLLIGPFGSVAKDWTMILGILSALSMTLGAVAAVVQTSLKRLMAYSSIGHMGYALIGLASGIEQGITATLVYICIYAVMNIGVFAVILGLEANGKATDEIASLSGFSKTHSLLAASMAILMFSMAGIPPLLGFTGKLLVFQSALVAGHSWLLGLAILGVLTSVISAFYYLRIIKVMYFDDVEQELDAVVGFEVKMVSLISAAIVSVFIVFSGYIIRVMENLIQYI